MIKMIFEKMKEDNLTLAAAESITGGRFTAELVSRPGASKVVKGSFVCYTNDFKYDILGVSKDIEIVSEEMAIELAKSAMEKAKSSIGISFTGNASPNGMEDKERGLSWVAVTNGTDTETFEFKSNKLSRIEVIEDTVNFGLEKILNFLRKN